MNTLAASLNMLEPMERIEYLLDLGKKAKGLPDSRKTDANKVYGCAPETWLTIDETGDGVIWQI